MVMNLLQSLNSWLQDQSGNEVSYEALKKILDNTVQVSPDRVWMDFSFNIRVFFCFFCLLFFKHAFHSRQPLEN